MPEKRAFRRSRSLSYLPIILLLIISSCIPQKRLLLLQDKEENDTNKFVMTAPIHKFKSGDEIYVRVIGLDAKTYALFNGMPYSESGIGYSYNPQNQLQSVFSSTYTVNDSGYIPFPLIKHFKVADLNADDAQRLLQDSVAKYANFAVVILKYVNFTVSVIGEVKTPGLVRIDNENVTLFQAISLAGDFGDYANKNTVKVVRKTENGTRLIQVDLTDRSIFGSEVYYLMPDDVVYVAPLGAKSFSLRYFQLGTFLSIIGSTLVIYSLFR